MLCWVGEVWGLLDFIRATTGTNTIKLSNLSTCHCQPMSGVNSWTHHMGLSRTRPELSSSFQWSLCKARFNSSSTWNDTAQHHSKAERAFFASSNTCLTAARGLDPALWQPSGQSTGRRIGFVKQLLLDNWRADVLLKINLLGLESTNAYKSAWSLCISTLWLFVCSLWSGFALANRGHKKDNWLWASLSVQKVYTALGSQLLLHYVYVYII